MVGDFEWKLVDFIEILINIIGLLMIDFGAIFYTRLSDDNLLMAFLFLSLGNAIGGILYKYKERKR